MIRTKTIEHIVFFFACLALISPLVFFQTTYVFPFIVPKILYFRIIAALLFGGYLILLAAHKKAYSLRLNPLHIASAVFFGAFALSTFTGEDWYRSMWDGHERMLGLFTVLHYGIYYFVCVATLKEWPQWKRLLQVFLSVGVMMMLLGLWQRYGNVNAMLNKGNSRVSATLGNPIYFSAFGMFCMFLGAYLWIKERADQTSKIIAGSAIILGFFGIFLGGSRGVLVGALIGGVCAFLMYWLHFRSHEKYNKRFISIFVCAVLALSTLYALRTTEFVSNMPAVGRLLNTHLGNEFTNNTRIMAWGIAVEGWQDKPLFGWGPNNYMLAFNKYYRPEFLEYGWTETWFDNAHNVVLNTLTVGGIVGLLAYLGLFAAAGHALVNGYKLKRIDIHEAAILGSFLVAHFVSNVFIFENPTSYLYFFFTLGLIYFRTKEPKEERLAQSNQFISTTTACIVVGIVLIFIYATNVNPARANKAGLAMVHSLLTGSTDTLAKLDEIGKIPTPHIDDIRADFGRTVVSAFPNYIARGQSVYAKELLLRAYDELEKNKQLHPSEIRTHIDQATIARRIAQTFNDQTYLVKSEAILDEARTYSPKRQQIIYMLATTKTAFGKHEEAIALLEEAVKDDPNIGEGWWRLANTYFLAGQPEKAREVALEGQKRATYFDEQGKMALEEVLQNTSTTIKK